MVLTFTASDDDNTKKTDYGGAFVVGANPGSWWTPARSEAAPAAAVSATYTITIADADSAGFTIEQSGSPVTEISIGEGS